MSIFISIKIKKDAQCVFFYLPTFAKIRVLTYIFPMKLESNIFKAYDIRGVVPSTLNEAFALSSPFASRRTPSFPPRARPAALSAP